MQNEIVSPMKGIVEAVMLREAEAVKKDAILDELSDN
jgi:biotin carboxyl carrier protein